MDVDVVQMLVAPVKNAPEDVEELRSGSVAADEEAAPDERAAPSQDDAE